jgi:hypothetical protein
VQETQEDYMPYTVFDILVLELPGVLIAILRLTEPVVFEEFKKMFAFWRKKESSEKFASSALCSFLNSAMNIELVSVVIIGVTNFMDLQTENQLEHQDSEL